MSKEPREMVEEEITKLLKHRNPLLTDLEIDEIIETMRLSPNSLLNVMNFCIGEISPMIKSEVHKQLTILRGRRDEKEAKS